MDKIWDNKSFKVGGYWPLWRGRKTKWLRRTVKSWTLKKEKKSKTEIPNEFLLLLNHYFVHFSIDKLAIFVSNLRTIFIAFNHLWVSLYLYY